MEVEKDNSQASLQKAIQIKGESIFNWMSEDSSSIFNKDYWYEKIMNWSMKNEHFKTQMFRFVDVLPSLQSSPEITRHLKEYFAEGGEDIPSIFNMGVGIGSLAPGLMASAVKKNVTEMAKMFIVGESTPQALKILKKSRSQKIAFTADLLGEACLNEAEASEYQKKYHELLDLISQDSHQWDHIPQIDEDHLGPIPKVNISIKLSSLFSQINVKEPSHSIHTLKERLRPILAKAVERNVFVNLDMEQYAIKAICLEVFKQLLMEDTFKAYPHFGIVIQAYLKDSLKDLTDIIEFSKKRGSIFSIRLVKGAYWDYEVIHALQNDWPIPVYTIKSETDANYEACTELLLKNSNYIKLALGSHNVRSIAHALVRAERLSLDPRSIEVQMLYGMADPIKKSLIKSGSRIREYAPIGDLLPGMAYLVRRLLENTSNESFLKSKFADHASNEKLLKDPKELSRENLNITGLEPFKAPQSPIGFKNESLLDLGISEHQHKIKQAILDFKKNNLEQKLSHYINGQFQNSEAVFTSVNPAQKSQIIAYAPQAHIQDAEKAIASAAEAFNSWSMIEPAQRALYLLKLADIFKRDRYQLIALEVLEAGKNWAEADGDITEAIDFCTYYAKDMLRLSKPINCSRVPGETSFLEYQPKGVSVVIAPWNFPLAILTGMVAASLVTGNTVIMKPAEQTPAIGSYLLKALLETGIPQNVVQLLHGNGEVFGDYLTSHPLTSIICFTGSQKVGLHIMKQATKLTDDSQSKHKGPKRIICEMGGKNAIIVDNDADLDEAVGAILYSAFGFQGQKCSAASRIIALEDVYQKLMERLVESAKSLIVGPAEEPISVIGPVIDEEAQSRILKLIQEFKNQHKLVFESEVQTSGFFVPACIFADVEPNSRLAQVEIFGPVIAMIKATNIDQAIQIANQSDYALTGGVFSRSPGNIEKCKRLMNVGNLYINRGITGAMVDRHPFGGHKMSGLGSKTGGPDYLIQFMDPKVITENTLRRGFAPQEEV